MVEAAGIEPASNLGKMRVLSGRVPQSCHCVGEASLAAVYDPYGQEDELCIKVDLAWWTPDGRLAPVPWRLKHRKHIAAAFAERDWAAIDSPGLPLAYLTGSEDDDEDPPLAPDPYISAHVAEAVIALYCPTPEQWAVSVGDTA